MRQKSHEMKNDSTKWVLGHKVTTYETTGDYDLAMGETPAQVQGPPPHIHNNFNESFLITEGEMEFFINGELRNVKAGESVDIPPKTVHTFGNKSTSPCKWINIHSPKGFRAFFENTGIPAENKNAQEASIAPKIVQKVIETAADFDMIIKA